MAKSRRSPSLMRKARKTSSGKILALGVFLAALAYVFASSTASFNPASLLASVSGTATTTAPLKVVAPNGGEVWAKGSTQTIKWSGGASTWKLEVLLKNASTTNTVVTIATSTANTGSISWKIPTTVRSRTYNIRIRCTNCPTGTKGMTDLSDKPFTITDAVALPDLTATSVLPTTATVGMPVRVIATTTNRGNASTGAGFNVVFQRATSTAGSGAAVIGTVPTTALAAGSARQVPLNYTFPSAGTYYVRACADLSPIGIAIGGSAYGFLGGGSITESNEDNNCGPYTAVVVSGASTTIPTITVLSPNGGETITAGGTYTLRWSTSNFPTGAKVHLQVRSAYDVIGIAQVAATSSSYVWNVPQTFVPPTFVPTTYKLEAWKAGSNGSVALGETVKDQSDASFTIVSSPSSGVSIMVVPSGGGASLDYQGPGANDDKGSFRVRYLVSAIGSDVFISPYADVVQSGVTTGKTSGRVYYKKFPNPETVVVNGISAVSLTSDATRTSATGNYRIPRGTTAEFELRASVQLPAAGVAGDYALRLGGISWSTTDVATPATKYTGAGGSNIPSSEYFPLN